jgi:hypothetical protein
MARMNYGGDFNNGFNFFGGFAKSPGEILAGPRRISNAISKVENIPFVGEIVEGLEATVPGFAAARGLLGIEQQLERDLKKYTGVDLPDLGSVIDEKLGLADKYNPGSFIPHAVNITPNFNKFGFSSPHFNFDSSVSYAGSNKSNVAVA